MQLVRTESSDLSEKILPRAAQVASAIGLIYLAPHDALRGPLLRCGHDDLRGRGARHGHDLDRRLLDARRLDRRFLQRAHRMRRDRLHDPRQPALRPLHSGHQWPAVGRCSPTPRCAGSWAPSLAFVLAIATWLVFVEGSSPLDALRHAAFNVVSLISTTGFVSSDYALWGTFPVTALFFLMCIGGCTGSTSGGIKIFRFTVLHAIAKNQIARLVAPARGVRADLQWPPGVRGRGDRGHGVRLHVRPVVRGVRAAPVHGRPRLPDRDVRRRSPRSPMSAPGSARPSAPPALSRPCRTAPNGCSRAAMLLGRLELFTVLILFTPAFWRI